MYRNFFLLAVFIMLSYIFWLSSDFQSVAAGVAIFLFGMLSLQHGFRLLAGGKLEEILRLITDKLWKRLGFGIVSTMLTQSSSLVSVVTISFLSVGLLDLASGIGIVFGANLGTTTGAWLVAGYGVKIKITVYALPLLVFGILLVLQKPKSLRGLGHILSGVGFLLLGIHFMKEGFESFSSTIDLTEYAISGIRGLLIYVLIGLAATVIIQSSDATMVLIITALSVQQVTYENAVAMAVGTNIGTTVTAIIGSMSANVQGKRLAAAHFLFNLVTGTIALVMINQLLWLVDWFCTMVNIAADDYTLKLAAFHSLFNLAGIALLVPWINPLAKMLEKILKPRLAKLDRAKFLNKAVMIFPATIVEAVRQETIHLYRNAILIVLKALGLSGNEVFSDLDLEEVISQNRKIPAYDIDKAYNRKIKGIYSEIIAFISNARVNGNMEQADSLYRLRESNLNIVEAVKGVKHLQKNLFRIAVSDNKDAIGEYDKIRFQLAVLIREIDSFRLQAMDEDLPILALDHLKVKIEQDDQSMNASIDRLIRKQLITPETGTSLINDNAYLYEIKQRLVEMAQTVFVMHHIKRSETERLLSLNKEELIEVAHSDVNAKNYSGHK